jgi:hypothetical protein
MYFQIIDHISQVSVVYFTTLSNFVHACFLFNDAVNIEII